MKLRLAGRHQPDGLEQRIDALALDQAPGKDERGVAQVFLWAEELRINPVGQKADTYLGRGHLGHGAQVGADCEHAGSATPNLPGQMSHQQRVEQPQPAIVPRDIRAAQGNQVGLQVT